MNLRLEQHRANIISRLTTAMQIEHATIPPYLCAMYSMVEGYNVAAWETIRTVAIEEMLHMVLVANLRNAMEHDASFDLTSPGFVPEYPAYLPESDQSFTVVLAPFSEKALDIFVQIERPGDLHTPTGESDGYVSIGEFYNRLKEDLKAIVAEHGDDAVFCGDPARQINAAWYFNGGGEIVAVTDQSSALRAIRVIVNQGEGFNHNLYSGDHEEFQEVQDLAHYYKFREIQAGRRYLPADATCGNLDGARGPSGETFTVDYSAKAVRHAVFNYNPADLDAPVQEMLLGFSQLYWQLLGACEEAFNGGGAAPLKKAHELMYVTKYKAEEIMNQPLDYHSDSRTGPLFLHPDVLRQKLGKASDG